MHEEAAFLNALAAEPADDATWLVYADWLEERGDPRADILRSAVALSRGIPPDELEATAQRFGRMKEALPEPWAEQVLHLWGSRPVRMRIVHVQILGNIPPQEMFDRAMTHLHCVLESGRVRRRDQVVIPLEDGGTRHERVDCLFDWRRTDYEEFTFGREPMVFGLMWPGHRRGALRGGLIVPRDTAPAATL
jgi:uncharacterized protein (TIGR02996 family)